ncbi:probable LRR receptor-like serine/threonine-protein kinase At4g36180 [Prosopis cineraria]|uniref:probable LRR receptor-like serine/threonine-protein kinase At4g36180 n=1 Tax=Prosopis cineraria TaxID=364024 RepID=UPI00240F02FB|nr:probable LRR receptor-like serine/threonine-protein kinase At4g36180 [Prosopis cineraria]
MGLEGTLPSQIGNLSFLEKLKLQSNNFHCGLPKELLQLHKLEILNLSYNALSGEIPTWIGSLFMLQHLSLGNNSFGGLIPPSISNLSKLETLDLKSNSINGSIPLDIGRLQHLKVLCISRNMLSGSIPPSSSILSSLEHISLSLNFLEAISSKVHCPPQTSPDPYSMDLTVEDRYQWDDLFVVALIIAFCHPEGFEHLSLRVP